MDHTTTPTSNHRQVALMYMYERFHTLWDGSGAFGSPQAAFDYVAVNNNGSRAELDTVLALPGVYSQAYEMEVDSVVFAGYDTQTTILDGTDLPDVTPAESNVNMANTSDRSVVQNLTFRYGQTGSAGVTVNSESTVQNCLIRGQSYGVVFRGAEAGDTLYVNHCTFDSSLSDGAIVPTQNNSLVISVKNSLFTNSLGYGLRNIDPTVTLLANQYNLFYNNATADTSGMTNDAHSTNMIAGVDPEYRTYLTNWDIAKAIADGDDSLPRGAFDEYGSGGSLAVQVFLNPQFRLVK